MDYVELLKVALTIFLADPRFKAFPQNKASRVGTLDLHTPVVIHLVLETECPEPYLEC